MHLAAECPWLCVWFWLLFKTAPWFWILFSLDVGLGCCFVFRFEMSTDVNGTRALKVAQTEGCLLQTLQAIPGMLLALVLCFDHRKGREHENEGSFSRGNQYIRYAVCGYSIGLITALAAGLLSQLPQPALLYLVSSSWQLWCTGIQDWWNVLHMFLSMYTAVKWVHLVPVEWMCGNCIYTFL